MFEPWCEPWIFITAYGSFVGAVGGLLIGAAGGGGGDLARKGQQRAWVGFCLKGIFIFGLLSLVAGVTAAGFRQPFGISGTLVILGVGLSWLARKTDRAVQRIYQDAAKSPNLFTGGTVP
jgi:hypothetical protein